MARAIRSTRVWAILLALVTGLAGLTVPATVAHAAPAPHYCWVFEDVAAPAPPYTPNPARNSCGATVISYSAPNVYLIRMPNAGAAGGVVHVTSVTDAGDPAWCQAMFWSQAGADELVYVACFGAGGAAAATPFSVAFTQADPAYVLPAPAAYAYLYANSDGALLDSWTSGSAPAVAYAGTGLYLVSVPLGGAAATTGDLQVTAVALASAPRHCKVAAWSTTAAGQSAVVACYDAAGTPQDTAWTLTYQDQADLAARPAADFGYAALFGGALPLGADFNSQRGLGANAIASTPAFSKVLFPAVGLQPDNVQVTAYGATTDYCHLAGLPSPWIVTATTDAAVPDLECFTVGGDTVAGDFLVSYAGAT